MVSNLTNNISLLIALVLLYSLIYRRLWNFFHVFNILSGLLFGIIATIAIFNPYHFSDGVIFDGRSIILSLAPFFCGYLGSMISLVIAALSRLYIGGDGLSTGLLVIATSVAMGMAFKRFLDVLPKNKNLFSVLLFAYLVNIVMLLEFYTLPDAIANRVVSSLWLPILFFYPLATVIIFFLIDTQIEAIRSERKIQQALHEKSILLDELCHRTKNNMQVIIGFLSIKRLLSHHEETKEALISIENKVYAMAIMHQMLYKSQNLSEIPLREYIHAIMKKIIDEESAGNVNMEDLTNQNQIISATALSGGRPKQKFNLQIPDLLINIDAASPIGLIINELVSNSLKHGVFKEKEGVIEIDVSIIDDNNIIMRYVELGAQNVANLEYGLGLMTIKSICQTQLLGSFHIDTHKHFTVEMRLNLLRHKIRVSSLR